jgi:hypothetical protein
VAHTGVKKIAVTRTQIGPFFGDPAQRKNNELVLDERNQSFDAVYTVQVFTPAAE